MTICFNFNFFENLYHININIAVTVKSSDINISINFFIFLFKINALIVEPKPAQVVTEKKHIRGAERDTNNQMMTLNCVYATGSMSTGTIYQVEANGNTNASMDFNAEL